MKEDYKSWNKYEFLAFVLIEAAFADKLMQKDEKEVITSILPIDRFYQLLEFYRNNMPDDNKTIIVELKEKFYASSKEYGELRDKIRDLFTSDGQFSEVEKDFEKNFEKLFE